MEAIESKAAVYRHLIAHLDKIGQLRRNPLAAPLFEKSSGVGRPTRADREAVQRIRALLAAALDELVACASGRERERAERTRTIVLRCDLAGETHKAVAVDLGLSPRQFYRERERSICAAGERLEMLLARPQPLRVFTLEPFAVALQQVTALRNSGFIPEALGVLERAWFDAREERQRIVAACLRAELLAEAHRYDEAFAELQALREHNAKTAVLEAAVCVSLGIISEKRGSLAQAGSNVQRAIEILRGEADAAPFAQQLLLRALLLQCDLCVNRGSMLQARATLADAERVLHALEDVPPELQLEYHSQQCNYYSLNTADSTVLPDAYARGMLIAQQHGLPGGAVNVTLAYSTHLWLHGRASDAVRYAREALKFARFVPASQHGSACLIAAEAEIEAHRLDEARDLVRKAQALLQRDSGEYVRAQMLEAQIECLYGHFDDAIAAGKLAAELAQRADCMRFAGASLRIVAEAYVGSGRPREARASIYDALAILQTSGHGHSLTRARRVSALIERDFGAA